MKGIKVKDDSGRKTIEYEMKSVKNITIVGGGTAGWMTAVWCVRRAAAFHHAHVTLIDKEVPERIGVGEANLLNFNKFMQYCGFDDPTAWMEAVDATYKGGIMYPNWGKDGKTIYHPFGQYHFHTKDSNGGEFVIPFGDVLSANPDIDYPSSLYFFPSLVKNKVEIDELSAYSEQLDCGKYVEFLIKNLKGADGFTYINSTVENIHWDGEDITSLDLADGTKIEADIFIDCTGFKRLLSEKREIIDYSDRLFVDTAVATRVQYIDKEKELHPYTTATATDHGWIWETPLTTRIGTGHVFNRHITDPEDAKECFVKHWNGRFKKEDLRVINWDPCRIGKFWEGNVINIGLSGGFIEPLESTGIGFIINGIELLEDSLIGGCYDWMDQKQYNMKMINDYESAVDFISMHYDYSHIQSPFWDHVRKTFKKSGFQKMMESSIKDPDYPTYKVLRHGFFGGHNWAIWLHQLMEKEGGYPAKTYFDNRVWRRELIGRLQEMKRNANKGLPHLEALEYKPTLNERMISSEKEKAMEENNMKNIRQFG